MLEESALGTGGEWPVAVGGSSETREGATVESGHETLGTPTGAWSRRWTAVAGLGHTLGTGLDIKEGEESGTISRWVAHWSRKKAECAWEGFRARQGRFTSGFVFCFFQRSKRN